MLRYFKMNDDVEVPRRWFLSDPTDRNGRELWRIFLKGRPVQIDAPVRLHFNKFTSRGNPVDYSELSSEAVPVVHVRVATVLAELAPSDVQIFPVQIEGVPDQFCIVNVAREVECIDDKASRYILRYTSDDGEEFAHCVGEYRDVRGLRIDKTKVGDAKIFRPWGWPVAIIVSEEIKNALEQLQTVGVRFTEV